MFSYKKKEARAFSGEGFCLQRKYRTFPEDETSVTKRRERRRV